MIFLGTAVKFFCLLTPFFVFSVFLDVTAGRSDAEKRSIANKTSIYILTICLVILFFGEKIFSLLGITLVAFQIGSGIILFLSSLDMMRAAEVRTRNISGDCDPSLIPLAMPVTVGPGTIGALFVMGADMGTFSLKIQYSLGVAIAVLIIWLLLFFSGIVLKVLKEHGLQMLSRLTGLFLAVLSVQTILNGIISFAALLRQ